jgi:hypothetical protein
MHCQMRFRRREARFHFQNLFEDQGQREQRESNIQFVRCQKHTPFHVMADPMAEAVRGTR